MIILLFGVIAAVYIAIGSGLEPDTEVRHREISLLSLSEVFQWFHRPNFVKKVFSSQV